MFNIRKVKDTIVSKSVIPTSTTARMNAKLLADNFKLKEDTSKLKELLETLQAQSPDVAVQSPVAVQPLTVEKKMEQTRIQARVSTMTLLDEKARKSQEGYSTSSRFLIRNCKVGLGALNCPNQKIYDQIVEDNTKLMAHGKAPFTSYESWVQASENESVGSNPEVNWKKFQDPVLASSTVPVYISSQDYFLRSEQDQCYFLTGKMAVPSILKRSASECVSGQTVDNSSILMSKGVGTYRNMSKSEYNDIVASQARD